MAIISDVYGRRYLVLGVWLLFCIASIVSMTANSIETVIVGQTLSGVSAGISGIMFAIASETTPSYYRAHVQTAINAFSGLAAVLALVGIGGIVSVEGPEGWRWTFRLLFILSAITFLGFAFLYFVSAPRL